MYNIQDSMSDSQNHKFQSCDCLISTEQRAVTGWQWLLFSTTLRYKSSQLKYRAVISYKTSWNYKDANKSSTIITNLSKKYFQCINCTNHGSKNTLRGSLEAVSVTVLGIRTGEFRHIGQVACNFNHGSTHCEWKRWSQSGNSRSKSLSL